MNEMTVPKKPRAFKKPIMDPLLAQFADSRWYTVEAIQRKIEAPAEEIVSVLNYVDNNYKVLYVVHKKQDKFRISSLHKTVSVGLILEELLPIIENLKAEGRKPTAKWSPGTIARIARELELILEGWL